LDIRSGDLRYCINSYLLLLAACLGCGALHAQLALGRIEGVVLTTSGKAVPAAGVLIEGGGLRVVARADGTAGLQSCCRMVGTTSLWRMSQ